VTTNVGGQAVLEGVMMRGPSNWAVAVRRPDGRISEVSHPVTSWAAKRRWLRWPVIRGIVALGESLAIGFKAIAVSADYAATSEGEEDASEGLSTGYLVASFAVAIVFSIGLFKVSPLVLTDLLSGYDSHSWQFVIIEGFLRVGMLVGYLALISLVPDLKRVFQYHAAEHKAINAYEAGDELTPENVQRHSLIHVRCGTAFLLWVMVIAIFLFAALNAVAKLDFQWLIVSRIVALLPIAGLAYEVIRLAGKHGHNPVVRAVLAPGLWLQRLTTRQPDLDQVAVSISALQRVLELEQERRAPGAERVEVMA
jgi:uncharacterized protein YqhQ